MLKKKAQLKEVKLRLEAIEKDLRIRKLNSLRKAYKNVNEKEKLDILMREYLILDDFHLDIVRTLDVI